MKPVIALLALAGALSGAAFVAPPAEAHTRASLRTQLHRAEAKLVRANTVLKTTRKKLASAQLRIQSAQLQVQALTTQVTQLRGTLAQTKAGLAASEAHAAALQAKLDAIPTPLAVAVEQVRREVAWAEHGYDETGRPYTHGQLVALSAMNYVVGHVSTGAYGYLGFFGGTLPSSNPNSILGAQAGICGHAALTFAAIVRNFGLSVRSVQFYYATPDGTPDSHIADEVFYEGRWHFFDPTFGIHWTDGTGNTLAIVDARAGSGAEHKDWASFTNFIEDPLFAGDDSAFETDPATSIVLGSQTF